ncbi:hypothetical protein [Flavobacterium sp. KACC 22761]|uniref:hypothetical protein n=1 Tax=Flavobacterium sp. KACC 22761 TaxID=3092665 RepID=UPI002A757B3B|nr:hypothetical protein [Flavobacterium sp. KACC 22761]WPO78859.1 hypothetical protein SCB73_00395 [Flavobacterium sp. KACC 22761]
MKAHLLILAFLTIGFSSCSAQNQATVYAKNSDISDNLDLRAVASMFGESANLQDFERRLNDPKYQISNLDLNGDDQVDYLRVIESVENRTHVVIIQAVLDRDVYQDVATIDVERDNYNKVSVQVVGNAYLYGANYIYEPVYNVVPVIYSSFWVTNYRPYCSTWYWGYYPTYYTAWRPYPVYRYRNNVNICINANYSYNYVNYRRSYVAPTIYASRRTYGYERMRPNYSFAERHGNVNNRYELDQRRVTSRPYTASQNTNNPVRSSAGRPQYGENRVSDRSYGSDRNTDRNYNNSSRPTMSNRENPAPVATPSRPDYSRNNSDNRNYTDRSASQNNDSPRSYPENRRISMNDSNSDRPVSVQRSEPSRNYSENRGNSENRSYSSRPQNAQRSEAPRMSQESRGGQPQRESGSRGGGNRRG